LKFAIVTSFGGIHDYVDMAKRAEASGWDGDESSRSSGSCPLASGRGGRPMAPGRSGSLERLDVLVGDWETSVPGIEAEGRTTFEWLEGGGFLIERSTVHRPEFPNAICVIGATGPDGGLQQHYFDSRGVARVYEMTLEDGVWTLFREGPDWPQRYVGRLSEAGDAIEGRWELGTEPGAPLEHDFDVTYRRVR
jgi:hypothetical protein